MNNDIHKRRVILIAEDDPDDQYLIENAIKQSGIETEVCFAQNGQVVLDYFANSGDKSEAKLCLLLLDLNMPILKGTDILAALNQNPEHRKIPSVVFSTSSSEQDIQDAYRLGANAFIVKPNDYKKFEHAIKVACEFWLNIAVSPNMII